MATFQDVLQRAETMNLSVKMNGRGFSCLCPVHGDDRNRHLYIAPGDKVAVVFHCKHGCEERDIVAAFGFEAKDVGAPRPIYVAGDWKAYQYPDESGTLLYESVRGPFKDGAKAKFRRPDPTQPGKHIWNLPNEIRRVPYNLQQLRQAKPGDIVLDVEGEPDVETCVSAGFIAYTNPGGAGSASEKYLDFLPPGVVIGILRDYDDDGRKLAAKKAAWYKKRAIRHAVIDLPGLVDTKDHGEDVSDWIGKHGHTREELRELVETTLPAAGEDEWEEPIPLYAASLPEFPVDALPSYLRAMVEATAWATQTPPDLAAMVSLAVLATATQKRAEARVREGWQEVLSLWTVVSLPPGNRKTPAYGPMVAPVQDYERLQIEQMRGEIAEARTEYEVMEGSLKRLKDQAIKAKSQFDREELTRQAVAVAQTLERMPVPKSLRMIADDATPEELGRLLFNNGGRMAIISDEGDVFDMMAGKYSSGKANIGIYLRAHQGSDVLVDRVGRPDVVIRRAAITFGLCVQPESLQGLTTNVTFKGRGLVGRFLFSNPYSLLGKREIRPTPLSSAIAAEYAAKITRLLEMPAHEEEPGVPQPHIIEFSPEADDAVAEFERWLEPQFLPNEDLGHMGDWAGKLAGQTCRIAALLHLAEMAETPEPWSQHVDVETFMAARRIAEYLIPHAKAAFREMGRDPAIGLAGQVLTWLKKQGKETFQKRDVFNAMRNQFERADDVDPALVVLVEHGFIQQLAVEKKPGPGQPPSPTYRLHPSVLS